MMYFFVCRNLVLDIKINICVEPKMYWFCSCGALLMLQSMMKFWHFAVLKLQEFVDGE